MKYILQLGELDWPKIIAIGLFLAGIYFFIGYDDGSVLSKNIATLTNQLAESQRQLRQTEKAMEDANQFEKQVLSIEKQFEKIREFMPEDMNNPQLTAIVSKQASLAGVRVTRLSPVTPDQIVGFYQTTRIALELEGTFAEVVTFFSYMSRVPKLLTIEDFKLTPIEKKADFVKLRFSGSLVGYKYFKNALDVVPPAGQPGGPGIPAVPAAGVK